MMLQKHFPKPQHYLRGPLLLFSHKPQTLSYGPAATLHSLPHPDQSSFLQPVGSFNDMVKETDLTLGGEHNAIY